MSEKKHIFCAALCLAAVLFLSACAASAGHDYAAPPKEGPSNETTAFPESAPAPEPEGTDEPDKPNEPAPAPKSLSVPKSLSAPETQPVPETVPEESAPTPAPDPPQEDLDSGPTPETNQLLTGSAVVQAQAEPVDDEYFSDAAFIGNSLIDGMRMFSGLTNCDYYARASMTILGIGDYITQMSSKEYGKIYMLLGINELTYNESKLMQAYSNSLDRLMSDHPNAVIYIMGLSPVSAAKDASGNVFTMANIRRFNERLLQLAEDKNCCYIDLCDALGGADGFLPADVTTDGIHFTASEYKVWLDYLRLHYIPVEEEPEIPAEDPTEAVTEAPAEESGEEPGPTEDVAAESAPETETPD